METRNIGGRLVAVLHSRPTGRGSITRARVEGISVELGCDSFEIVNLYAAELPTSRSLDTEPLSLAWAEGRREIEQAVRKADTKSKLAVRRHVGGRWSGSVMRRWGIGLRRTCRNLDGKSVISGGAGCGAVRVASRECRIAQSQRDCEDRVSVFRGGGDRPSTALIVSYIDDSRDRFGSIRSAGYSPSLIGG